MITDNQSFAPSETLSSPIDYKGGHVHINKPLPTSATTPNAAQPSDSYSQSLAISEQVNASQDHNFDLNYSRNLKKFIDDMETKDDTTHEKYGDLFCGSVDKGGVDLEGSLKLDEIIDGGLLGIDRSNTSVEKRSGAPHMSHTDAQTAVNEPTGGGEQSIRLLKPNTASGGKSGGGKSSGDTQFSSKIDFSLTMGGGASVNANTLWFKLGNGGGGSGGGSGSAGGGGQQMLNMSKSSLDTLTMTFSANCKAESRQKSEAAAHKADFPLGNHLLSAKLPGLSSDLAGGTSVNKKTPPLRLVFGDGTTMTATIDPIDLDDAQQVQKVVGFVSQNDHYALIQGYAFRDGSRIDIEGTVSAAHGASAGGGDTSSSSANVSFKMTLAIGADDSVTAQSATLSGPVASVLGQEETEPQDYWASLPACSDDRDLMLAKAGQSQNILLKLPQALRFAQ